MRQIVITLSILSLFGCSSKSTNSPTDIEFSDLTYQSKCISPSGLEDLGINPGHKEYSQIVVKKNLLELQSYLDDHCLETGTLNEVYEIESFGKVFKIDGEILNGHISIDKNSDQQLQVRFGTEQRLNDNQSNSNLNLIPHRTISSRTFDLNTFPSLMLPTFKKFSGFYDCEKQTAELIPSLKFYFEESKDGIFYQKTYWLNINLESGKLHFLGNHFQDGWDDSIKASERKYISTSRLTDWQVDRVDSKILLTGVSGAIDDRLILYFNNVTMNAHLKDNDLPKLISIEEVQVNQELLCR